MECFSTQDGKEGVVDHQSEEERAKREIQNRIGVMAQARGARCGIKKYFYKVI